MKLSWKITGRVLLIAVSASALAYSIVMIARYPGWVVDDAFILFRYAENLVEYGELTWNIGENPVEGYTGITMVSLIALAMKLSISPVLAAHIIGIACYFIGAVLLILIFRGFNLGSVSALALYFAAPFLFTHAWSGLETTMFNSAILLAIYTFFLRKGAFFVGALIVLGLTRPEGALISLILLALYRPLSRRMVIAWLVPCMVYFLWRWIYYGQFLPNTFYAKSAQTGIRTENIEALREMAVTYLTLPGLLALIFISRDHLRKHKGFVIGTVLFTLVILHTYLSSRLVMNYSYRFFIPAYTLSLVALGGILCRVKPTLKSVILIVLLVSLQVASNVDSRKMKREIEYSSTYYKLLQDEHIAAGEFLRSCVPSGEWLVVHSDAGAIPYYSKLKTIDFGRLNDEYLARNVPFLSDLIDLEKMPRDFRKRRRKSGSDARWPAIDEEARLVEYFFFRNPAAIAFTSYNMKKLDHGLESILISEDDRFVNYALVKKYSSKARSKYFQFIYLRDDIRLAAGIPTWEKAMTLKEDRQFAGADSDRRIMLEKNKNMITGGMPGSDEDRVRASSNSPDALWALSLEKIEIESKKQCYEIVASLYPDHEKAPEALWLLAQVYEQPLKKIEYLKRLVDDYPENEHSPEASFMIGFVYSEELGDTLAALEAFRMTLKRYPQDQITESAGFMIESLKSGMDAPVLKEEFEE